MRRAVFTVFLLTVAMGGGWLFGQQEKRDEPTQWTPPEGLFNRQQPRGPQRTPLGSIFSGPEVGIRLDREARDGKLYGTLMVKTQSGEWVEVSLGQPSGVMPLDSRR